MKTASRQARPVPGGERLLARIFTRLGCQGRPPHFVVEYFPYANLSHTLRFRGEAAHVRLSDLLENAPVAVMEAAAALLLARAFRKKLPPDLASLYRRYCHQPETKRDLARMRRRRCRPLLRAADRFELPALFRSLNTGYFQGSLRQPQLGWSHRSWTSQLGAFDPALDRIVMNRRLDRTDVPRFVVEYVLYHEMLHVKHPGELARCGLRVHSAAFRAEEKQFARYQEARLWLQKLR